MEDEFSVPPQRRTRIMGKRGRQLHLKQSGLNKVITPKSPGILKQKGTKVKYFLFQFLQSFIKGMLSNNSENIDDENKPHYQCRNSIMNTSNQSPWHLKMLINTVFPGIFFFSSFGKLYIFRVYPIIFLFNQLNFTNSI